MGYQLTGENANTQNLITGTRYLNVQGMLPFENAVADYVDATGNHVLMAVAPVFEGSELVARGVHMMAESVEDGGEGVAFNVFCYNVQPGVVIDYGTGESMLEEDATPLPDVSEPKARPIPQAKAQVPAKRPRRARRAPTRARASPSTC
ncbi:MAG: DNA/RNA non-specific endonuclease [Adlercreutzia equolifaciens]